MASIVVIGGGLAGSEAAWQASRFGVDVTLYEMRPVNTSPAGNEACRFIDHELCRKNCGACRGSAGSR